MLQNQLNPKLASFDDKQCIQGHILKFIKKGKTPIDRGIICFPQQTYGNAQQAPQQFKTKHGLAPINGYLYRHENKPQFKYYSQQRYFSIDGSKDEEKSKFIHVEDPQNQFKFHRKKGKFTEFIDKNGWMNKTIKMMGFERDERARDVSNKDRAKRISAIRPKINYQNLHAKKPNTSAEYFKTMSEYTTKKMQIRAERNGQAQRFSITVQPRNIKSSHRAVSTIQVENMQDHMLRTTQNWSPSKTTKSRFDNFSKTRGSNRLVNFESAMNIQKDPRQYSWRENCDESLEDWHRTTCNSNWVYNKKMDSEETEKEK